MQVCVFCSSSNAIDQAYADSAAELGRWIVNRGHALISGGANVGLMEILARTVLDRGGEATGIIPENISNRGLAFNGGGRLIVTPDLRERKRQMAEMADGFIVLPGGFGTLEEALEILTLKQLQQHNKPVVFLNTARFFDPLLSFFHHLVKQKFAKEACLSYFQMFEEPLQAIQFLESYQPTPFEDKWFKVGPADFFPGT